MAFVGRDRELAELLAGFQDALRGEGRVLLVVGEPGIGKTALAEQVSRPASGAGARALWARAWEGGGAPPYWLWSQILRELAEGEDGAALRRQLAQTSPELSALVPNLAKHMDASDVSLDSLDSDRQRFVLFESVARFLQHASSIQPLVLVLDDVLAGDRASVLLLRFMAREVRRMRVLVVATCRDVEVARPSGGEELMAAVVRDGRVLHPIGLSCEEVRTLITEVAGVVPSAGKLAAIYEAAGGNPLFVREVTRLVSTETPLDQPGPPSISIPPCARAVIRQRLIPLSPDAVVALSAGAVVGREFDLHLVEAACELPRDRIVDSLAEGQAAGIVTDGRDTATAYRFSHPLIREVIYEDLPLPARMHMHRQVGEAIERLHGSETSMVLADLALHFTCAAATGDAAKALEYARRAGDRAMTASAFDEATAMYRSAIEALGHAGQDKLERCDLLLRLGLAQTRAAHYDDAEESYLEAVEIARELGANEHLARAALGLGERQVTGGAVGQRLVALLEEALDALSPCDTPLRARLLARLSLELTFSSDSGRREALSHEAVDMARRLGDASALVTALRARWMAAWGPDEVREREALTDELLALATATADPEIELIARARRITCALETGDIGWVDREAAAHAQLAADHRSPFREWSAATIRTMRTLLRGSLVEAERLADAALSLHPGHFNAVAAHLDQLTLIRWEQRRLGELRDQLQRVLDEAPKAAFGMGWLCLANAELGRREEARGGVRAVIDQVLYLPQNGLWLGTLAAGALAVSDLEDPDAAEILYPLLLPYADLCILDPMPHPVVSYGSASFYLALLASTTSQWEEAEVHFQAAIRAHERLGATALLARTRCEYAHMLIRRGRRPDRGRAVDLLERAAATASTLELASIGERVMAVTALAASRRRTVQSGAEPARPGDASQTESATSKGTDVFRREGDYWTVVHRGSVVRVRDSKGLRCLARLLSRPAQEILALDLEAAEHPHAQSARTMSEGGYQAMGRGVEVTARPDLGDAGELLDASAKAEYKARLDELRSELEEAEGFNDPVRAARIGEEMEFLACELARAVGLGGRDRKAASHAERARLNVTRAIRAAMKNLSEVHPSLGEHLLVTIRTGRYCCYAPDPRAPIRWER